MQMEKLREQSLVFLNKDTKTAELDKFENLYCMVVLTNGYWYKGFFQKSFPDYIHFMDKKEGEMKFSKDKILLIVETPKSRFDRFVKEEKIK